jgi:hypothetical protein
MEQDVTNLFTSCRAARLAGDGDRKAAGAESASQLGDLRALAAAVKAFERDEFSERRHVGMIAGRRCAQNSVVGPDFTPLAVVRLPRKDRFRSEPDLARCRRQG